VSDQTTPSTLHADAGAVLPVEGTVPAVVSRLVADDETVLLVLRPSVLMVPLWSLEAFWIIAGMTFAFAWAADFGWAAWTEPQAFGFGLVAMSLKLLWQFLDWANRLYVLTDRRVIRRRGILQVDVFEARLDRIQQTNVLQLVRERTFGLGTVAFATAGTGTLDALWEAVADPFRIHTEVARAIDRYGRGSGSV
jgi:membrane protein YdbS with pleckstrin-like domain